MASEPGPERDAHVGDVGAKDLFEMSVGLINRYDALGRQRRDYGTGVALSVAELHLIEIVGRCEVAGEDYAADGSPPMTATQIARRMGVTKGAVSQMLLRLERKGIVARAPLPADGRASIVSLTELGRVAFERHAGVHRKLCAAFEGACATMPARSRSDAARLISAIAGFLDGLQGQGASQVQSADQARSHKQDHKQVEEEGTQS